MLLGSLVLGRGRLGHVMGLLLVVLLLADGSGLLDVLLLLLLGLNVLLLVDGSGGGRSAVALERGIVPAGIVLAILIVSIAQAGSDGGGGEVVLLGLLHVLGGGGRRGGVWGRGRADGQMVSAGTESANLTVEIIQLISECWRGGLIR